MANQHPPTVSVLITVFNGERFLAQAVQSVLAQTGVGFELVVVDDGSTDATNRVLDSFADRRVIVVRRPRIGRGRALNLAIAQSRGCYIAILDADDICLPGRLAASVAHLERHPDVAAVGAARWTILDEQLGVQRSLGGAVEDQEIRSHLRRYRTPFPHSSVMFRRAAVERVGGYDEALVFGFDLDIIARVAETGRLYGLDSALVQRRFHDGQFFRNQYGEAGRFLRRIATRRRIERRIHRAHGGDAPTVARAVRFEAGRLIKLLISRLLLRLAPGIILRRSQRCGWKHQPLTTAIGRERPRPEGGTLTMMAKIENPRETL